MIIYPAIDLQQGRVVCMQQGDPKAQTVYSDDPVAVAQRWVTQGAQWLHVINLDAAFGTPRIIQLGAAAPAASTLSTNLQTLDAIRRAVDIAIQYGGGLRTLEDIHLAFDLGADRVVLGTIAVEKPKLICEALKQWGSDRIVVRLDARDGIIATHGWQTNSGMDVIETGHHMYAMGVRRVLYTDIRRDGMLTGVNIDASARLGDSTGLHVIVSGGVATIRDIELLKEHEYYNIDGVVIGQSLYTDRLNLTETVALGNQPLIRHSAGIIPYRLMEDKVEILLIYNYALEQWQLPRGHIEQGESAAECAQREFSLQTNLQLAHFHTSPVIPLNFVRQFREYQVARSVTFFLGQVAEGEISLNSENHCETLWTSPSAAFVLLREAGHEQLPALKAAMKHLGIHAQ